MIPSLFSAISALNAYQYMLNVVSDNISNANTTGFKSSRVTFQDLLSQVSNQGAAPSAELGGINPVQVGSGVRVGTSSPIFLQGVPKNTGRNLDIAIQGDGFLVYDGPNGTYFSRDGALEMDSEGFITNGTTGLRLQGWNAISGSASGSSSVPYIDTNMPITDLQVPLNQSLARQTSLARIGGNLDATTDTSGSANYFDSTFGTYDSLGNLETMTMRFTRTSATASSSTWNWSVVSGSGAGSGSITFGADGKITAGGTGTISVTGSAGAASPYTVNLDFSGVTQLSTATDITTTFQDGLAAGIVNGIYISPNDGNVYLLYSNGLKELRAQIAMAKFVNPSGLLREGQNLYKLGLNSGEAQIGTADSGGRGVLVAGYLEESNVDMAKEFTSMIVAQRGFQAAARVVTTSDQILQELVNLTR